MIDAVEDLCCEEEFSTSDEEDADVEASSDEPWCCTETCVPGLYRQSGLLTMRSPSTFHGRGAACLQLVRGVVGSMYKVVVLV